MFEELKGGVKIHFTSRAHLGH
ncbi:rCG22774 [Rattus norvegicus]|nr:rCG22774 [Rattus norvegicus]